MQRTLQRLFESDSLQVSLAGDGPSGLDSFRKQTPDAVILDLKLPGLSGKELCREFKAISSSVPIVVLSANSEVNLDVLPEYLKQGYLSGEFLPVDLPDAGLDVEAVEKQLIVRALQKFGGNQTRAAQFLNMSRRAFSYRLKKHGLNTKLPKMSEHVAG